VRGGGYESVGGDQRAGTCKGEFGGGLHAVRVEWLADGRDVIEKKTMRFAQPGLSEADLQAHFEYICARGGAQRPAYVPVVASG